MIFHDSFLFSYFIGECFYFSKILSLISKMTQFDTFFAPSETVFYIVDETSRAHHRIIITAMVEEIKRKLNHIYVIKSGNLRKLHGTIAENIVVESTWRWGQFGTTRRRKRTKRDANKRLWSTWNTRMMTRITWTPSISYIKQSSGRRTHPHPYLIGIFFIQTRTWTIWPPPRVIYTRIWKCKYTPDSTYLYYVYTHTFVYVLVID